MDNLQKNRTYSSIYMIRNKVLNKHYVGRSIQPENRLHEHFSMLRKGDGSQKIQKDFDKYGESAFETKIIETLPVDECDPAEREDYYILKYNAIKGGYNSKMGSPSGRVPLSAVVNPYVKRRAYELAMANDISSAQWVGKLITKEIERIDKGEQSKG